MKKWMAFLLASLMMMGCAVGCSDNGEEPDVTDAHTDEQTTEIVTTEPVDDTVYMYYDDRKPVAELLGKEAESIEIKAESVTSKKVSDGTPDAAVLKYDEKNNRIIAIGTGTAIIVADGEEFDVKVNPAPITLILITGHSLGMGSKGNTNQSVLCEAGQAYMSDGAQGEILRTNKEWGLGLSSTKRPLLIDRLTADGGKNSGRQGVDGGLAFEWNRLTGEKVWVLNCAVGGSCINEWQKSEPFNATTVKALNAASGVLKNEVAAGHYVYKGTSHINFSTANFSYKNVSYNDQKLYDWHDGLWSSIVDAVTVDIDGDGKVDPPTSLGYVPLWDSKSPSFDVDMPLIYYRAVSKEYPHVFMASEAHRLWTTDALVSHNFPKIDYVTHDGKEIEKPTKLSQIDADGVHLTQLGYNAQGQDIAKNLYNYLRTDNEIESITIRNITESAKGSLLSMNSLSVSKGKTYQFVIVGTPSSANNLDITVDGVLEMTDPKNFKIKVTAEGTGTLTIKSGDKELRRITFKSK